MGSLAQTFTFVPSGKEKDFALSSALGGSTSVVDSVFGSSGNGSAHARMCINKKRNKKILIHSTQTYLSYRSNGQFIKSKILERRYLRFAISFNFP
jgi:hypothetical protein